MEPLLIVLERSVVVLDVVDDVSVRVEPMPVVPDDVPLPLMPDDDPVVPVPVVPVVLPVVLLPVGLDDVFPVVELVPLRIEPVVPVALLPVDGEVVAAPVAGVPGPVVCGLVLLVLPPWPSAAPPPLEPLLPPVPWANARPAAMARDAVAATNAFLLI